MVELGETGAVATSPQLLAQYAGALRITEAVVQPLAAPSPKPHRRRARKHAWKDQIMLYSTRNFGRRYFTVLLITMLHYALARSAATAEEQAMFPFLVSYDAPANATNVSSWLDKPAGKHGFIRVENGRLAHKAGPIRFHGTNLCFDACFPTREQADRLAARLARFGVNVVRMHHMDSRSIWGKSGNHLTIDPDQLDRLDYLIHRLKEEGVYTNLNLHVSRWLGPEDGFSDREKRPNYDKGLDNFEPRMIELQKKYAKDLLSHKNPYTGNAYAQESAIAFIEINNENALFDEWNKGSLGDLPDPYASTFRKQWNAWLLKKYRSTEVLRNAWKAGEQPLGDELLAGGKFQQPIDDHWTLERDDHGHANWSVVTANAERVLQIKVHRPGSVSWRPQLSHRGFAVKKGGVYTLSFVVRADTPRALTVNCTMAHDPWENLGLSAKVDVTEQASVQQFTFLAIRDDSDARITFSNLQPGVYELSAVSLRPGGVIGLATGEMLENDSVAVMQSRRRDRTETARHDFIDFLWDTEQAYWTGMHRFLRDELKVNSVISGTQLSWSPVHTQAQLDYIDAHAYWQHPSFPGRPWDPRNWFVRNVAMVNSPGGELTELAARRVAGKPFTVSEYNHPAPGMYAAEGLPMLAAFAAHQAWDGIYSFAWAHNDEFEPEHIGSFFDIQADPTRLVHLPACAAMLLRGDVPHAQDMILTPLSHADERQRLHETGSPWTLTIDQLGGERNTALLHRVALDLQSETPRAPLQPVNPQNLSTFLSDSKALRWDHSQPGKGFFLVDSPRTKLLTGFVEGRTFDLGDVKLAPGVTRLDWVTISLTCLDGPGFGSPGRILVAATSWRQNTDWPWEELGDDRVTLRNQWGRPPILCEGVPAKLTLPTDIPRTECYALDASGERTTRVALQSVNGEAQIDLDPRYKTLWYEIVIK
jgi:hypothetical protein